MDKEYNYAIDIVYHRYQHVDIDLEEMPSEISLAKDFHPHIHAHVMQMGRME